MEEPMAGEIKESRRESEEQVRRLGLSRRAGASSYLEDHSDRELLGLEENERALRLIQVSTEADRVFGDPAKAARWLRHPNPALAGKTPIELLASEMGSRAVGELLIQIDHGIFP
jgi:putative toxin-antitoxin system antitoxin component (TIGR02293 family)